MDEKSGASQNLEISDSVVMEDIHQNITINAASRESVSSETRSEVGVNSSRKFGQVFLPAVFGSMFGMFSQYLMTSGYLETPFSPETYLGSLLDLLVILVAAIPAIGIQTLTQRNDEINLREFFFGGMTSLVLCSFFGLLFSYCLLPVCILLWFYSSMSWSKQDLPDFRLGFWAGLGCVVGALCGSIATVMMMA